MSETSSNHPQRKIGLIMLGIAWLVLLALMALFFDDWIGQKSNPNQQPSSMTTGSTIEVTLRPNHQHHYVVTGAINGYPVTLMLDTGATDVVIPEDLARRIGLKKGYPGIASTANGNVTVYSTSLDSVTIGDIHLNRVPASINPGMEENVVLLGMSALRQIEFAQRGDVLILRQ